MASAENTKESAALFLKEDNADVHFIVGEEHIPGHKGILSDGSPVFTTMFYGEMAVSREGATAEETIVIEDIECNIFKELLRYVYTGEAVLGPDSVMHTLYSGKKYEVKGLVAACIEYLLVHTSPDNAFMLLEHAKFFHQEKLTLRCLQVIAKNTVAAMEAQWFSSIALETLCSVLAQPILAGSALQIFEACLKWAKEECVRQEKAINVANQREVLGEAIRLMYKNHFLSMTLEEFSESIPNFGILNQSELVTIFQRFAFIHKEQERKERDQKEGQRRRFESKLREQNNRQNVLQDQIRYLRDENEREKEENDQNRDRRKDLQCQLNHIRCKYKERNMDLKRLRTENQYFQNLELRRQEELRSKERKCATSRGKR